MLAFLLGWKRNCYFLQNPSVLNFLKENLYVNWKEHAGVPNLVLQIMSWCYSVEEPSAFNTLHLNLTQLFAFMHCLDCFDSLPTKTLWDNIVISKLYFQDFWKLMTSFEFPQSLMSSLLLQHYFHSWFLIFQVFLLKVGEALYSGLML